MMLSVVFSVHWPMSLCTNLFLNKYFVKELCCTVGLRTSARDIPSIIELKDCVISHVSACVNPRQVGCYIVIQIG
jgi:hypothetical protein